MEEFNTFRVKCLVTYDEYSTVVDNKLIVAVVDIRDDFNQTHNVVYGRVATFFDRKRPKDQSLRVCSCTIRRLNNFFPRPISQRVQVL